MRGTRWLLLVAILAIICGVGLTYRAQRRVLREQAPAKPATLPDELSSTAQNWCYSETTATYTKAEVCAQEAAEEKDSGQVKLKRVTLNLHNKNGQTYDLIRSAAATYYKGDHRFYSEGEVDIALNIPEQGQPSHTPITIKTSGVNFDTSTGKAETDRPSSFVFERGSGTATGASYDPATHELYMKQDVKLDWKAAGPHAKPMRIEAASLSYHEAASEIRLRPWGRLIRENTVVEGENVTVHLEDNGAGEKNIRKIDAVKAHGTDVYPRRKLQYAADELWVDCNDDGQVQKITGQTNARLVATGDATETTVTAFHVEMNFNTDSDDSVLTSVSTSGNSIVTAKPLPVPNRTLGETHVLRSEVLEMKMRDGGREIDNVFAATPGTLEFIPNLPVQRHRTLDGKNMHIVYAARNRIESFRADDVHTRTDPNAEERKRKRGTSMTSSRQMQAWFDPATSRLSSIEQTGDFTYEEGDRRARSEKARLDSAEDVILLDTGARMWDASGSTSADHIRLDQGSGDFTARGNVNSSRLPEKNQKKSSEMLSGDEPLQAQAARMESKNRNRTVHYEGKALMWQGANRIQAETIDLDREKRTLTANGGVVTNLWEEPQDPKEKEKKSDAPVMTEVRAQHLLYTEADRLAYYTGGAELKRPNLRVTAREIRAYLAESGADSRLEKATAEGAVRIVQTSPDRTRTGTAEHSEYYSDEQKIVLKSGMPKLVDTKTGTTIGPAGLTYWADDDRLLVNGSKDQPVQTRIKQRKK